MDPSSHLLLLEDDADIGTMVSRFMREQDFPVSHASNGKALDRMLADSRVDLILLDLTQCLRHTTLTLN
jgi:two-component system OmpR family response regulator